MRQVACPWKLVDHDRLDDELLAAGVPWVTAWTTPDAVLVTLAVPDDDASHDAATLAVVAAHVPVTNTPEAARERTRAVLVTAGAAVRLAASATRSAVTPIDAGLAFDLAPNAHYAFEFVGAYSTAANTTGIALAVNGPASPALVRVVTQIAESLAGATRYGTAGAYDTPTTGAGSAGATPLPFFVRGNVSTGENGGTFGLRFASEVGGSQVTILAGSYGLLHVVG